jgi:hypothetical protein
MSPTSRSDIFITNVSGILTAFFALSGITSLGGMIDFFTPTHPYLGVLFALFFTFAFIVLWAAKGLMKLSDDSLKALSRLRFFILAGFAISIIGVLHRLIDPSVKETGSLAAISNDIKMAQTEIVLGLSRVVVAVSDAKDEISKGNEEIKKVVVATEQVKREISSDPQKELQNLGRPWTSESLADAINSSDEKSLGLFISGGWRFSFIEVLGIKANGLLNFDINNVILHSRFCNQAITADLNKITFDYTSSGFKDFYVSQCKSDAVFQLAVAKYNNILSSYALATRNLRLAQMYNDFFCSIPVFHNVETPRIECNSSREDIILMDKQIKLDRRDLEFFHYLFGNDQKIDAIIENYPISDEMRQSLSYVRKINGVLCSQQRDRRIDEICNASKKI